MPMTETYTTRDFVEATGNAEFVGYLPGARECSRTYTSGAGEEFARVGDQASKMTEVPTARDSEG